jgi:O-antigen/teichoic acid export membrane protein
MLFPLITFPYAARILMAEGIGIVNFYTSIISYISLFTCLGIPMYAVRETARVRDNQKELSKTTLEIILLHAILTIIGYVVVFILCGFVSEIQVHAPLFLLLSLSIFFNAIGVEWFYKGIENFRYITLRGIIIRSVSVAFLFIFVKSKDDLMYYAAYSIFATVGNNIFNFFHLRKFLSLQLVEFHELHPFIHLKPSIRIFVLNLIVSIYVNLDSVMLGFIHDSTSVGYYTGATKITHLSLSIITSLGTVMLPRLSNLIQIGLKDDFNKLAQKSIDFVMTVSVPVFIGIIIMSPVLIHLFCGDGYIPAILTLQIISPIIVIIAMSNALGIQILYPQGKEKWVIISTAIGAMTNFIINIILIPRLAQNGAAIATVVAESCVTLSMFFLARNYLPVKIFTSMHVKTILAALMMGIVCLFLSRLNLSDSISIFVIPTVGGLFYTLLLVLMKNPFIDMVKNKLHIS